MLEASNPALVAVGQAVSPPRERRNGWAWPFLLALAFATAAGGWLQWSDAQDLDDQRRTLITDALTLQSRITDWLAAEQTSVQRLAEALPSQVDDAVLLSQPPVAEGLRRLWVSVTVLDAGNRVVADVPPVVPSRERRPNSIGIDDTGLTAHIATALHSGGRLVVRIATGSLLRQTVPWWLARKYDVRLLDGLGQVIAASGDALPGQGRQSYRVSLEPALNDTLLELTTRDTRVPWWRTLPLALLAVFVLLSAASTRTLRRQMREVAAAEARWRTEAAWRRAIEDSLTVGLRARDAEGRIVHVNRAFCDLVGLPPEQLLGHLPPMPYWPPDSVQESMQRHRRNMAGGAPREGYEARWRRSDGTALDVMIFEAPLVDAAGQSIGRMGSIVDVTARKQGEERERRHAQLIAARHRLAMLGEVGSALAHQLNQPLAAIAAYNGGVVRSLQRLGCDDAAVHEALQRVGEQAVEAGRIVQRIRGFLTRHAPQPERCALGDIVARAQALLKRDLEQRGVQLECDLAAGLPALAVDPVLIEQVLINLLLNAADAMEGRSERCVRIAARRTAPRFVRVDVDDSGPGLGGRSIELLSAPFHSTKTDGMGMGLAICRSIVEAHHGHMEAGAAPLGGARLSFSLPVADAAATQEA